MSITDNDVVVNVTRAARQHVCRVFAIIYGAVLSIGALVLPGGPVRVAQVAVGGALIFAATVIPYVRSAAATPGPVIDLPRPIRLADATAETDAAAEAAEEMEWWLELLREAGHEHDQLPIELRRQIAKTAGKHELLTVARMMSRVSSQTRHEMERTIEVGALALREATATRPSDVASVSELRLIRSSS